MIQKRRAMYVGPTYLHVTDAGEEVFCILPDYEDIVKISLNEAKQLCTQGHAEWKSGNVITLLRNVPLGPALSLRVGGLLATAIHEKGKDWAKVAVQEIVGRKG